MVRTSSSVSARDSGWCAWLAGGVWLPRPVYWAIVSPMYLRVSERDALNPCDPCDSCEEEDDWLPNILLSAGGGDGGTRSGRGGHRGGESGVLIFVYTRRVGGTTCFCEQGLECVQRVRWPAPYYKTGLALLTRWHRPAAPISICHSTHATRPCRDRRGSSRPLHNGCVTSLPSHGRSLSDRDNGSPATSCTRCHTCLRQTHFGLRTSPLWSRQTQLSVVHAVQTGPSTDGVTGQ